MKKLLLMAAMVLSGIVASAQTNQVVWLNGRAVLGQSINQVDSLKFGQMKGDTLHLILPTFAIVRDTVFIHDTVYVYKCDTSEQDTTKGHAPKGVEMVDLGLSVKWANMNVGATKVEEYGDYFAWGETSPKTDYSWSTYKYCNGSYDSQTKYCTNSSYGTVDNKTTLEKSDDAASVNWGGNWRMPTLAEQEELKNNCTITWTDNYQGTGVAGCIFTSKKTGYTDKSIFLPAAGYRNDTGLYYAGSYGYYWSSSLYEDYSGYAWYLGFYSDGVLTSDIYIDRYYGQSVRAVCP